MGYIGKKEQTLLNREKINLLYFHQGAFARKVSHFPFMLSVNRLLSNPKLNLIRQTERSWLFERKQNTSPLPHPPLSTPAGALLEARSFHTLNKKIITDKDAQDKTAVEIQLSKTKEPLLFGKKQILPP